MAKKNLIDWGNVQGYSQYGVDEYENIKKKERKKRFEQYEKEDAWTDFSAFEDGYQFGDVSKAILGTGVKTGQNFTKGLQSNLEGLLDFGTNVASMGTEALGYDEATKKLRNFAQKDFIAENDFVNKALINTNPMLALLNQGLGAYDNLKNGYDPGDLLVKNNQLATLFKGQGTLSKGLDKIASKSITGNKLDSLSQTVGQIAGQAALGSVGLPWQVTAFANSAGNEMNNAFQNNATAGQAFLSGLISGAVEVGTEYIGGGANKLLGMESLGSKGLAKLGSKISNKLASRLLKIGIDASSEGLEEVLSGLGTAIGQKLTYMNDKEIGELYSKDQALDDFVMGALGTVITNVPGQVQSVRRGENAFSGLTENEQTILDKVIEERTNEAQKDGKELTKKQLNEIEDQAREDLQNGYISADMIEETLGDNFNADKDLILRESFNERTRRRNSFNTDLSQYKNENQRKIVQKAIDSGILNDSKKTHNFVDLVSKIAADKGMDFDFTNNERIKESGFGVEGKTVNGYVNGNTIGLNIESNNALNKTVGHEITHVLEGSDMYQALQDSLRSYVGEGEWNARLKDLAETYKNVENADVTKELTADLVGENLFNNEDFVRSLSTKDRNLFEKIYDEIKYLVKIATAGSKEKRDLVKLQKVFQEAYRDSKTTREGTQYSLSKSQQKYLEKTNNNEKLKEKEFYSLYSAHKIYNTENATNIINSIKENGFKGDGGFGVNLVPSNIIYNQDGTPMSPSDKQYAPKKGEYVLFVPENEVDTSGGGYRVKQGYKPRDFEVVQVERDYQPYYELYEKAYDKHIKQIENTKYSLTDNQGRQLSEQQQEFFKDSKVRDDEGRLLEVYHGSPNPGFTVFDTNRSGQNTSSGEYGLYFTDSEQFADDFSYERLETDSMFFDKKGKKGDIYPVYLNAENVLDFANLSEQEINDLYNYASDLGKLDGKEQFVENMKKWQQIGNHQLMKGNLDLKAIADNSNYDGIKAKLNVQGNENEYIVFNSNQVKNIDNTTPTSNPDIRYSLSTAEEMEKYNEDRKNVFKQLDKDFGGGVAIWEANLDGRDYDDSVRYLKQRQSIKDKFAKENNIVVEEVKKPVEYRVAGNRSEEVQKFIRDNNATMENLINNADLQKQYFNELEKAMLNDDWTQEEIDNYLSKFNDYFDSQRQRPSDDIIWPLLRFQGDIENIIEGKTEEVDNIETAKRERELIDDNPKFDKYVKKYVDQLFNTKPVLDAEEVMEEAKYNHGTTDDYSTGAYMTTDGSLLDFNSHGYRDDHRTIDAFDLSLQEFMDYGAIRMQPEGNGFEISIEPTSAQYNRLEDYIDNYLKENGDKIYVDCGKEGQVYSTSTPTSKIINDIKAFFRDGTFPKQSEYAQFMYSLSDAPKQDNKGRELTLQQQDFYRNVAPQLRDENGNIKTFYHGTPAGNFTVFREGSYFSDREEYATGYQNTWASSISSGKEATNPKTYEVYLNITNPFSLSNPAAKDIYLNEYIKGGNSAYFDPYTDYTDTINNMDEIDWVEGEDLKEWIQENHPEFDGLILDEGGDGGYGEAEYRWRGLSYLPFSSNQVKNVDNLNPTDDADIRYQLGANDIAPTSGWNVRGEDIRLQSAVQETIAPLQEQVQQLQNTIEDIRDNIAPISEEEASQLGSQFDENEIAPTRYNLTEQESKRLDFLDRLERENMLTDNLAEERNELMAKEENAPEGEDMTPIESLTDVRDMDEVAKDRSANAYQYEHPEVKPYFQEEARVLLAEINEVMPGERFMIEGRDANNPTEWLGYKRQASEDVANLLDGYTLGTKYTKDQLREGLNAIIEDHGLENKAVSKRLEFMLDDRLRNGYETIEGYQIEPNQDYLNMLKEQSWDKYYDEAPMPQNAPIEEPSIMMTPEQVSTNEDIAPVRETRDIMEMVDNEGTRKSTTYNQRPVIRKQKSAVRQFRDAIQSNFINRNNEIDTLSKESGNRNIKFAGDMLNGAMGEVNFDINTAQTNNEGKRIGKSIKGLFENAKKQGLGEAFNDFLINYSNIDRYNQNKGSQTPLEVSKRLVRDYVIQYPEFKQWAKDVWNYGKNARQNLVDAGLIDQQTADYLGEIYPHYVPYVSDYDNADTYFEGVGELKPKAIKRARGGAGKLLSVEDALSRYTYAQKNAVRQNELYKEIVHTLGEIPSFGIDERTDYTNMKDSLFTDSRGNYLTAYEDGKQITTQVSSDLYKELSRVADNQIKDLENKLSLITKPLQKISEVRKNLITTWSPTFPITNAIKDLQDALFNSKHTMDMIKNYPSALKELATGKGDLVNQFTALYGSGLTMGEYSSDSMSQGTKNVPFLNRVRQLNEIVELAPRYAEFKASLQKGDSLQEAMYNAREVTTNFGRGGTITKALNRNGFTFLNASVQGFDKLIRNFSGENGARGIVQAMAKVAALGIAPALFNHLAFGDDDEEYEALPDYIKDNYYLIKTGDENFIRIPKGRMLSIFGSAARRTLEASQGEENAFEGYLKNAWDQVGINDPGENNIFAPFIQAFGSENGTAWYGGDIVPTRLQDKPKGEQYDETTDKFSIWLGGKLGVSPKKINYALDQYLGGIGDILLPMGTEAATSEADSLGDYIIAPIKDKFTADSVTDNKYVSDFYSKKDEITTKSKGQNATDEEKAQKEYLDTISSQMSALYKEKREVQGNPDLSKAEKYQQSQEIKREINRLAKEGLDNYQNVDIAGDYASIGGNDYQRSEDGWKKVSSKSADNMNTLGLNSGEKETYINTQSNISNIKNTTKDYSEKKNKIVNEIRRANLDDDTKIALYNETYKDKNAQKYVNAGIKADDYLNFKSQTFTADKDSNGKSISGSKKQKVFNYINSMNIPFEQKAILAKTEYPTYNEYNQEIVNYLNNSDLSYDEMVDVLLDLGFKVDGDNVSW